MARVARSPSSAWAFPWLAIKTGLAHITRVVGEIGLIGVGETAPCRQ